MLRRRLRASWIVPTAAALALISPEPTRALMPAERGWRAPVPGEPVRRFDTGTNPYAAGAHRGVDLAARTGDGVAAACAGRIAFAGAVAGARVVTVACGRWRVTHLPLRDVRVTAGRRVRRGERLGVLAPSSDHAGLHVGVRRSGRRFGYVDPWPLLSGSDADGGPVAIPARPVEIRRDARRPPIRPAARAPRARRPAAGRVRAPRAVAPAGRPVAAARERLAPASAWVGLAALLAGVVHTRRRSRRTPVVASRRATAGGSATGRL